MTDIISDCYAKNKTDKRHDALLNAALNYAKIGLFLVPLHEPLFDEYGTLTGCTCEKYKRSLKYKAWLDQMHAQGACKHLQYDPNFTCPEKTRGKHPRLSDWEAQASNDPSQIRAWWQKWPTANLGLAVGKSGLVTFDLDTYKEAYGDDSDLFTFEEKKTATQISGGGGEHLVFQMPEGERFTNAKGKLPAAIDIRGVGGMQVVWPSIHPSGRFYEWEDGFSIFECTPKPLPAKLAAILKEAQQHKTAQTTTVVFTEVTTERPHLLRWRTSREVREMINNAPTGDRSAADIKIVTSLVYAGASDDDIRAIYQHYPVGTQGKYADRGDEYLAMTIGSARTYVTAHPRPNIFATIQNLRLWVRTHSFAPFIDPDFLASDGMYRTDATDTKVADAVFDVMEQANSLAVHVGKKRLAALAGLGSCNTALSALKRLHGWLFQVTIDPEQGTHIALDLGRLEQIDPDLARCTVTTGDQFSENDKNSSEINEYSPRKADEPFLTGTSKTIKERIQEIATTLEIEPVQAKADYTFPALGESGLRVIDALLRVGADMTAQELADETGKKLSSIRTALRKLVQHSLVDAAREGSRGPKVYCLALDVWQRVEEIALNLRTYGLAARRENKRLEEAQQWIRQEIVMAQKIEDKGQVEKLERHFAQLAQRRLFHLQRLYPQLSMNDLKQLAYEVADYKRGNAPSDGVRAYRSAQAAEHQDTVRMVRELAENCMDVETPYDEIYAHVMEFGTFDEVLVRSVLQSPKQMKNYETLADIRRRMAHETFTKGMIPPPPATPAQLCLIKVVA